MPRSRKGGRRKRRRKVLPRAVAKGIRDINKITSRVARGIDKYPLQGLRAVGKVVLKPRKFPGLRGGFPSAATRGLLNPGIVSTKKGSRRGGSRKRRGGSRKRRGGSRKRRGGRKTRRGGRKSRR